MKRISISVTDKFNDVYYYIKDMPNRSNYVCGLIRNDMNGGGNVTYKDVEELIDNKLKNLSHIEIDNKIENSIKEDLSNIFGL